MDTDNVSPSCYNNRRAGKTGRRLFFRGVCVVWWYSGKDKERDWNRRIRKALDKLNICGACYYIPGNAHQRQPHVPIVVETPEMATDARAEHGVDKVVITVDELFMSALAGSEWVALYHVARTTALESAQEVPCGSPSP